MILSKQTINNIIPGKVAIPQKSLFDLPEKVLQFGTGVLLRGLPDYFIDKANRQGIFNGRVVVVKSTSQGDLATFNQQDGLYTQCIRGWADGKKIEVNIINASISRALNATEDWDQVLDCAYNQQLKIIISNTTEVGIQLVKDDDVHAHPPKSFPGKLLAFLYERFLAFNGSEKSGMIIVPTELIPDNGKRLQQIVTELANINKLEKSFIDWLQNYNQFCNSLVDRIVPGLPDARVLASLKNELGYTDKLLTMSEAYCLWAIEGDEKIKKLLSFAEADEGVVIQPNIDIYRELKLRLLNGTHTLSCGLAFLSGIQTVKQAMEDETMRLYISEVMLKELAPAIPHAVSKTDAEAFAHKVLDRFRNEYLNHYWINITMQYSSKMKMRIVSILQKHYQLHPSPPPRMALGFAGYLYFSKPVKQTGKEFFGNINGNEYPIQDDRAYQFMELWNSLTPQQLVENVLSDITMWGEDLSLLPGFKDAVTENLEMIMQQGVKNTMEFVQSKTVL